MLNLSRKSLINERFLFSRSETYTRTDHWTICITYIIRLAKKYDIKYIERKNMHVLKNQIIVNNAAINWSTKWCELELHESQFSCGHIGNTSRQLFWACKTKFIYLYEEISKSQSSLPNSHFTFKISNNICPINVVSHALIAIKMCIFQVGPVESCCKYALYVTSLKHEKLITKA